MANDEAAAETLGVDIGGVLIERGDDNDDTSFFGDNYLRTPAVPGGFEALRRLNAARFAGRVHLVSKCREKTEAKTREWLARHRFHTVTGIPEDRVHFCRERRDKAPICARLQITHFVDDRLEVLGYLHSVPELYLFRADPQEVRRHARPDLRVTPVGSWDEVLEHLLQRSDPK